MLSRTVLHMADSLPPHSRLGKARAKLPEEYQLAQFLRDIDNKHSSWTTDTAVCQWDGVTCTESGRINLIDWGWRKLVGTPHWVHLSSMMPKLHIYLNDNQVNGEIDFKFLPMRFFYARQNRFKGRLKLEDMQEHLKFIYLGHCDLRGPISFHALPPGFECLCAPVNHLSGSLDFGVLPPTMRSLDLSNNNFSGPVDLNKLPYCISLRLDNNADLSGAYDPILFARSIGTLGTRIKRLPSRESYPCFLPLRYVFDSSVWNF